MGLFAEIRSAIGMYNQIDTENKQIQDALGLIETNATPDEDLKGSMRFELISQVATRCQGGDCDFDPADLVLGILKAQKS